MSLWERGKSANPRGRPPNMIERLFAEQLNIVAKEDMKIETDADGNDVLTTRKARKRAPKGKGHNSKASKKAKTEEKRRNYRVVMKLRRMAEVVFEMATIDRNLDAVAFIADRMDGKPTATQFIAVEKRSANVDMNLTYEEAKDRLLDMGIDVEKMPLLAGMEKVEDDE